MGWVMHCMSGMLERLVLLVWLVLSELLPGARITRGERGGMMCRATSTDTIEGKKMSRRKRKGVTFKRLTARESDGGKGVVAKKRRVDE